ncbi:MAG: Rrf2 family transcriptional regulator [Deltaproteobacteria bacterium]|nr:MAG: Rrf2 family transcriptional regulator [Deltaproteobacteria bacterium]
MRVALQVQYAVHGIFDLAYNGDGSPIQLRQIGERQGIPARYLEQIFQRLRRAGLVRSKRGPGGGYTLARAPAEISLRDIVDAVEGSTGEARRTGRMRGNHGPAFLWPVLEKQFAELLAETSIEDLCRQASRAAVRRAHPDAQTYVI